MKPKAVMDYSPITDPGLNGALHRRFSLTLIGDVRLELRARLPGRSFADLRNSYFDYASMRAIVSGSATNMARQALRYFQQIDVIAKVGDDAFTPIIRQHFREYGIGDHLVIAPKASNGLTMMVHDTVGVRLLLASDLPPSCTLSEQDMRQKARVITNADAVFCDGYSLLWPASRAALVEAADIARGGRTRFVLDLVPHDIDRRVRLADLLPVVSRADLLIAEVRTLAGLLGLPGVTAPGAALLRALDQAAPQAPLWLIRYGDGGMEDVFAYRRGRDPLCYHTGYSTAAEKAGFGDLVAASEIYWWLSAEAQRATPHRPAEPVVQART